MNGGYGGDGRGVCDTCVRVYVCVCACMHVEVCVWCVLKNSLVVDS